jgi:hypothetical protein
MPQAYQRKLERYNRERCFLAERYPSTKPTKATTPRRDIEEKRGGGVGEDGDGVEGEWAGIPGCDPET